MTCGEKQFTTRSSLECSGHGSCFAAEGANVSICVCEPEWTGAAHWMSAEGRDCHLSLIAIRVLWAILLVVVTAVFVLYFPAFWKKLRSFQNSQVVRMARSRRTRRITDHITLLTLLIYFGITTPSMATFAVLALVRPLETHVAIDLDATLLWWICRSSYYICTSLYQPALISTLVKQHVPGAQGIFAERTLSSMALTLGHVFLGTLAFVSVAAENRAVSIGTWVACMGGAGIIMIILALQALLLKRTLICQLDSAYQYVGSEEIKIVKERMESVQNHNVVNAIVQATIYISFAAIPYLYSYYDYLLPISWMTIPSNALLVVRTLMISSDSGNREGLPTIISENVKDNFGISESEITAGTTVRISNVEDSRLFAAGDHFNGLHRKEITAQQVNTPPAIELEASTSLSRTVTDTLPPSAPPVGTGESEGDPDDVVPDDSDIDTCTVPEMPNASVAPALGGGSAEEAGVNHNQENMS
ncbi:Hypothetical Protein FCC1311_023512 [Hondaea fermentalgiana]|uniref:Epidermal growth factor-like domain-containing protein n=1 Tax=Hondaea fermentalgiana TaxID=2315210 RepID=A0A2R5GD90_9STRA|nr:Hypothetical Protein FCC1311_023512 [Hondaea fermentalgiana]|eukprot:GBG26131.1 Hypothetical Protein FCC1311_023512 [Hondaea fermentalgiana]